MSESQTGYQSGPRVDREQVRDLRRLRRSAGDRYVAGVAGGLGRHLDIDPTIVRVLLVVTTFFGGAGLLVYAAVWLFVPEDGRDRAAIAVSHQTLNVVLIGTAVIAAFIVFGTPFNGHGWVFGFPFPVLVVALMALVIYSARRDRKRQTPPPPPWSAATYPTTYPAAAGTAQGTAQGASMSSTQTMPVTPVSGGTPPSDAPSYQPAASYEQPSSYGPPPAWMPPPPPRYVPPPRPRRTGVVLFWPTLALVAIGLGTLGVLDVSQGVPASAYAALGLGIVAVMLLVGAFVGRPGGLIALGLVGSLALALTSAVDSATGGDFRTADRTVTPTSAAVVEATYSWPNGDSVLDLTDVDDLGNLDGRTVDVSIPAGRLRVVVPDGLRAEVDAHMRFAGGIEIDGEGRSGFDLTSDGTVPDGSGASDVPTLVLHLTARTGQITVERG